MAVAELAAITEAASAGCAHCGLPVLELDTAPGAPSFCCAGCATAYAILHDHGLAGFYSIPDGGGLRAQPTGRSYEEFDHPAFHSLHVAGAPGGLCRTELYLEGV